MTIKEIRQLTNLSQSQFSKKYGIPLQTFQKWEQGHRSPPDYLVELLEFKVREDFGVKNENRNFSKPEEPFLLLYSNKCEEAFGWFETEEELLEEIKEITYYGFEVDCAIEIESCREIKFEPDKDYVPRAWRDSE